MHSIVLALLIAAVPGSTRPVSARTHAASAGRSVVTPEGIRFALPAGLAHSTEEADGRRVHVGKRADGTAAVLVTAFLSDTELPCGEDERGGEVRVEAFRTARGLRACALSAEEEGESLALVAVKAGETIVAITAVGAGDELAALARAVADSVVVGPPERGARLARVDVPKLDERLIGCFEHAVSVPGALSYSQRCFAEDLTFTQKFGFGMSTTYVDRHGDYLRSDTTTDRRERSGTWAYADGTLLLEFEDGEEAERSVEFAGDDLVLGGERWRRY